MIISRKTKKVTIGNIAIGPVEFVCPVGQNRIQNIDCNIFQDAIAISFYLCLPLRAKIPIKNILSL